jgi:hypothetical protein
MRWAGHVARMREMRHAYRIFTGEAWRERPLGRPKLRWEDNIKMDLGEVMFWGVDWMHLVQNGEHGNDPSGSIECDEFFY